MNTFFRSHIGLIFLIIFLNTMVNAQNDTAQQTLFKQIYKAAEQEYGIDHELINGIRFENSEIAYKKIFGHPYLFDNEFQKGSVVFRDKQYPNLLLRYDIVRQQLVSRYILNELQITFYLTKDFISEFYILNKKFVKLTFLGEEKDRFYQIIGEDFPVKTLYKWVKMVNDFNKVVQFSKDMKISFLLINNKLVRYRGNRSFVNKFPEQNQRLIKRYIKQNKIKVRYCADNEMELLLNYCNSIESTVFY